MNYFTDPILRAPTLGCMLMCMTASIWGVVLFLQKRLLLSETMSHAAYPGALLGLLVLGLFGFEIDAFLPVLAGAFVCSWVGAKVVKLLEQRFRIPTDAALGFSLAVFFGFGVLLTSWLQQSFPSWSGQAEMLLFGQAATLTDDHVWIYGVFSVCSMAFVFFGFRQLQTLLLDPQSSRLERVVQLFLVLSIVVGIRSVGVILVSGMLIAPALAARGIARTLGQMFVFSALIGALSGFWGNVLSVEMHLPTGPTIVLVSTGIALVALLFSPRRGLAFRWMRKMRFHVRCREENALKELWKKQQIVYKPTWTFFRLAQQGWAVQEGGFLRLTDDGKQKAAAIVRFHRLWELYLTEQLGMEAERVHRSAEEIEHILTPDLEERLTRMLVNPKKDPHAQPIPPRRT